MEGMSTSYMSSYRMVLHSAIRYRFLQAAGILHSLSRRLSLFLLNVSVICYPICSNHPAIRIKRIRLPVNQVDRIMVVGVTAQ